MKSKSFKSNIKRIANIFPELYLIVSVFYYWFLTANIFNYVAIVLLLVLGYQLLTRKKILGIIIATIFIILNSYMVLALLSELSEFPEFNKDAQQLALVGSLYLGLNIVVGSIMLIRYINKKKLQQSIA